MHHRHFCVNTAQIPSTGIRGRQHATERVQEKDGSIGQVHYELRDAVARGACRYWRARWPRRALCLLARQLLLLPRGFAYLSYADRSLGRREGVIQSACNNCSDEVLTVLAGRAHQIADLWDRTFSQRIGHTIKNTCVIDLNILLQIFVALGIQVVCEDGASLFCGRQREWTNSSKDISNDVLLREQSDQAIMLCVQPRIPVHLPEVEDELAIGLALGYC